MQKHKFPYRWKLEGGYPPEPHNLKVYSTFACGGGSTMGYKLAGFDVIGANDIDPKMARIYKENHKPKFYDLCPIQDLLTKKLPKEYYELDILDGSPPCSTFSPAGNREQDWKKKRIFREGQADQVLSDLFFDYIKLVERLKPKVSIAENVSGMLAGNARAYTSQIIKELDKIGYKTQLFLLDSSIMGVPQKRKRVFFISSRKDLEYRPLALGFGEKLIPYREIEEESPPATLPMKGEKTRRLWDRVPPGKAFSFIHPKRSWFNHRKTHPDKVVWTLTSGSKTYNHKTFRRLSDSELIQASTFPSDYNFGDERVDYVTGMSVPPVMMAQVASKVYEQWLSLRK